MHDKYTTRTLIEAQVRERVLRLWQEKGREIDPAFFTTPAYLTWIETICAQNEQEGLLLTERQWTDRNAPWAVGARARYVGPDREELLDTGESVHRPHGQLGTIIDVTQPALIFMPDASEGGSKLVRLTAGHLLFERADG